ncbi:MAG: putative 7-carboxy-7-deazaguanine synthase QueE [Anaerovoracaceae bacterium]|jgi:7-carboxy-7-deazaguanine synthase
MNEYLVAEHFTSINGEGQRSGEPAYFVRFAGCNLRCSYCDTVWARCAGSSGVENFMEMTTSDIVEAADSSGIRDVTLTGGEPLLQPGIEELIAALQRDSRVDHSVEIETNGSVDLSDFASMKERPVFTMDYKLPESGMEAEMKLSNMDLLGKQDSVKMVASDLKDLDRALEIIKEYDLQERCGVFISPVFGLLEPSEVVHFLIRNKLNNVRIGIQIHKIIWDPEKRGV